MFKCRHWFCLLFGNVLVSRVVSSSAPKANSSSELERHAKAWAMEGHERSLRSPWSEKQRLPMLELVSLSLDTFGFKDAETSVEDHHNRTSSTEDAHVVHSRSLLAMVPACFLAQVPTFAEVLEKVHPLDRILGFHLSAESRLGIVEALMALIILLAFSLLLVYCLSHQFDDAEVATLQKGDVSVKERTVAREEVPVPQSSWARSYYEAQGKDKEAFELLFRCNIISTEEFACGSISQERIQECLWIASHMLQNKPLDEWVALWQQAQQSFEESVAECCA
jgi:hypothetical protein